MSEHNQERYMDLIRLMLIAHVTGETQPEIKQYDPKEIRVSWAKCG